MLFCIAPPPPNFLCLQQALALPIWVLYLRYNFFVNSNPEVIQYVSTITEISDIDKAIIKHSRKLYSFITVNLVKRNQETQILMNLRDVMMEQIFLN